LHTSSHSPYIHPLIPTAPHPTTQQGSGKDTHGLAGLGLESKNWFAESLRAGDVETAREPARSVLERAPVARRLRSVAGRREGLGEISTRSALLVAYLLILHLMVMWSFQPHSVATCTARELQLP